MVRAAPSSPSTSTPPQARSHKHNQPLSNIPQLKTAQTPPTISGFYSDDRVDLADGGLNLTITGDVTTTDNDGDSSVTNVTSANISSSFVFGDDGPLNSGTPNLSNLSLLTGDGGLTGGNDTALPASDNDDGIDISALFIAAVNPGADGAATQTAANFQFASSTTGLTKGATTGIDTGLDLASGGNVYAYLSADGLTLTGTTSNTSGQGSTVFTININPTTGAVTQTQSAALKHSSAENGSSATTTNISGFYSDDRVTLGALNLTITGDVTTTDNDGDNSSVTVTSANISSSFVFGDDGPLNSGTPDLSNLSLLTGDGGLTGGNDTALPASDNDDGIDISALFIAAVNPGADGAATQTAANFQFASSTTGLTKGATTGIDTGLDLASGGNVYAYLSADGLTLTGTTSNTTGQGSTVFTITIDPTTGAVTQTQSAALKHSSAETRSATESASTTNISGFYSDDRVTLGALNLTITGDVTTTDNDGDSSVTNVTSANIANSFVFGDDGPLNSATTPNLTGLSLLTGDGGLTGGNDTALPASDSDDGIDISALFIAAVNPGADGAATQTAANFQFASSTSGLTKGATTGIDTGLDLASGGNVYAYLSANGLTLTGTTSNTSGQGSTVFTININPTTGAVTQTQSAALKHSSAETRSATESATNISGFYSDDRVTLGALNLTITGDVTTTDNDGDSSVTNVTSANISSSFVFGDDGPRNSASTNLPDLSNLSLLTGDGGLTGAMTQLSPLPITTMASISPPSSLPPSTLALMALPHKPLPTSSSLLPQLD